MTDATPNLYEFLGIERGVAQDDLIRAFRKKTAELSATANNSPESARNMQLLGLVYRTLNDPEQRRKYDATLPPETPSAPVAEVPKAKEPEVPRAGSHSSLLLQRDWRDEGTEEEDDLSDITTLAIEPVEDVEPTDPVAREAWRGWKAAAKEFRDKAERYSPALDALKILKPLTIDSDKQLIVGYDPRYSTLIGYLNVGENFNILRRMVCEKLGRSLDIRFVETTSLDEWIDLRRAELKVLHRTTQRVQAKVRANDAMFSMENYAEGVASWDELMHGMEEWPAQHPSPTPLAQARYIFQQIAAIAGVEDRARIGNMPSGEVHRHLNTALTRLGDLTGINPTVIALEYTRFRMR